MTDTASPIKQAAYADLDGELATTRRVLERVPEEKFDWKPHEKSMSLGQLASHVARLLQWGIATAQSDELDLAAGPPNLAQATGSADLLRIFDENVVAFNQAMQGVDDAALARDWVMRRGEKEMIRRPRAAILRGFVLSHIIHHRGQLSVYLRLLDVPVPSIYGPTADEPATF